MNSLIKKLYCDQQPTYVLIMDEYMKCIEYNKYMDEKIPALVRKMHEKSMKWSIYFYYYFNSVALKTLTKISLCYLYLPELHSIITFICY